MLHPMSKVDFRCGLIDVGIVELRPRLEEGSFLAAVADDVRPLVHNGAHRSYVLPKVTLEGREFRPSAYFSDGRITSVHLTWADPTTEGGSAWENHSLERERVIATEDAKWLATVLEPKGSLTETHTFAWGTVWSGLDQRAGFSLVALRYSESQSR